MERVETTCTVGETKQQSEKQRKRGTNLYGRRYCPGRPLSMEDRNKIISHYQNGMKVNAISKSLCISHGCVSKIISRYRKTGILLPVSSSEHKRAHQQQLMQLSMSFTPESFSQPSSVGHTHELVARNQLPVSFSDRFSSPYEQVPQLPAVHSPALSHGLVAPMSSFCSILPHSSSKCPPPNNCLVSPSTYSESSMPDSLSTNSSSYYYPKIY